MDGSGAERSFEQWYRSEHPRVLGSMVALSGDVDLAADVTDEAFVRALARWSRVSAMASPTGWTYRVALNSLKRKHRRRRTERAALVATGPPASAVIDPVHQPEVWDAVRALPEKQRIAIVLRYVADLPEALIAETMGVSRGTVASNLSDARRSLARFLEDDDATGAPGEPSVTSDPIEEVTP